MSHFALRLLVGCDFSRWTTLVYVLLYECEVAMQLPTTNGELNMIIDAKLADAIQDLVERLREYHADEFGKHSEGGVFLLTAASLIETFASETVRR